MNRSQWVKCPHCHENQPLHECDWSLRRGIAIDPIAVVDKESGELFTLEDDEPRMGACCNCGFEQTPAEWTANVFWLPPKTEKKRALF